MSERRPDLDAGLGVLRRDVQIFVSYRGRVLAQGLAVFFSVVLFYYVSRLVRVAPFESPDAYFGFVVVGIVVLEILTATLSTMPIALRAELLAGTFERLVVSPLGPAAAILAMCAFPALLSLVVGTATVAIAAVGFGLDLRWPEVLLAPAAGALAAVAFLPLSLLVAGAVLVVKQAGAASTFLVTGLSLASGAFFPVSLLPGYVEWVAEVQPLTPALDLLRALVIGADTGDPAWLAAVKLAGFALVLLPVSGYALAEIVDLCRRRGTLTEY